MASPTADEKRDEEETSYPKGKIKMLLLENVSQVAVDRLVKEGYSVETAARLTEEEVIDKLQSVHVIGIRSKTKLRMNTLLKASKKLLCIAHFCIGTDQTDLGTAANLGIPVFNSPFANTRSVAELVIAQCITLARKAGDQNRWMHQGLWKKTAKQCYEVRGKTLGIVGYGHVGSQLSVLGEALGMKVQYYDIIPKLPLGNAKALSSLDELLATSQFVSLHVPHTPETEGMIGAQEIAKMQAGSYLLNAARGKVVDIAATAAALKAGHLGGAYFDVYPSEPTDSTLPLIDCPNCVLTPHIGGSTVEAQQNIGAEVAEKIVKFVNEGSTIGAVNFPELSLQPNDKCHRILHVHKNQPGVLRKINEILADYNVSTELLKTTPDIGYLLVEMDADRRLSKSVKRNLDALEETIRTRVLFSPGSL